MALISEGVCQGGDEGGRQSIVQGNVAEFLGRRVAERFVTIDIEDHPEKTSLQKYCYRGPNGGQIDPRFVKIFNPPPAYMPRDKVIHLAQRRSCGKLKAIHTYIFSAPSLFESNTLSVSVNSH